MRIALSAFVAGVLLLQCSPSLLPWAPLLACTLALQGILGWVLLRRPLHPARRAALVLCSALPLGYAYASLRAQWRLSDALPHAWEGRDITVQGRIAELPEAVPNGVRFTFVVSGHQPAAAMVPQRLSLGWFLGRGLGTDPKSGSVPNNSNNLVPNNNPSKHIQWDLEIAYSIGFRRRSMPCAHVDLHRRQDEYGHG